MSGIVPLPKSHTQRQPNGPSVGLYGRSDRGPSQRSQLRVDGFDSGPLPGHVDPIVLGPPLHACTSFTAPIAPSCTHSTVSRCPSLERPKLPIWVATPVSFVTR